MYQIAQRPQRIEKSGGHGKRDILYSITCVWGLSPQLDPGAEPLCPFAPEAEKFLACGHPLEAANLPYCPVNYF